MSPRNLGTGPADDTGQEPPSDGASEAAARIEALDLRLRGLIGAFAEGLQRIGESLPPRSETAIAEVSRNVRLGTLADFLEASSHRDRSVPEHRIVQDATAWTLEAHLPGVPLHELRIEVHRGRLTLTSPGHQLRCSLPQDLREGVLRMRFQGGWLTLEAARAGTSA